MKINVQKKLKTAADLLVLPLFEESLSSPPNTIPPKLKKFIKSRKKDGDFWGKKESKLFTYTDEKKAPRMLLIGLGPQKKIKRKLTRELAAKIASIIKCKNAGSVNIILPDKISDYLYELTEGLLMMQYKQDQFKSDDKKKRSTKPKQLKSLTLITEQANKKLEQDAKNAQIITEGLNYTKDLVNTPSNFVDCNYFVSEAKKLTKENNYKLVSISEAQIKKMGWGGLLAVNQGANKPARCIALQYDGGKRSEKPTVVVGKGVIFDTGGYNLKPTNHIETMHQDMAGAATVLGLFKVLKKLKVKRNVIGIVPLAENVISNESYRPSDIIKMFSGKTVEITNTDAEGRLILADAITYGLKFKPKHLITIATLTGAVAVALGDRYAGLLGNDRKLKKHLLKAGKQTDDLLWPLPIHSDYRKKLKSSVADIRNFDRGTGRYAGCSKAAAFLENFVEKSSWAHIDIGGTAFSDDPKPYQQKGATGHGYKALIRFLEL